MSTTISNVKRFVWALLAVAVVVAGVGFVVTSVQGKATTDCLQKGSRESACGVAFLEQIEHLPRDAKGTQQAMIAFSASALVAAPETQRARLEEALDLAYQQIDDANAACFRNEIYDMVGRLETNRVAMEVGIKYIDLTGAISNLERPLNAILSELDPTADMATDVLEKGINAQTASDIESWAIMHSAGCSSS